jgi:hypothetical protein
VDLALNLAKISGCVYLSFFRLVLSEKERAVLHIDSIILRHQTAVLNIGKGPTVDEGGPPHAAQPPYPSSCDVQLATVEK